MNFDRNTVIGFVILAVLFFGYFYFTNKQQNEYRKQQAEKQKKENAIKDSLAKLNKPKQDSLNKVADSIKKVTTAGTFQLAADTTEKLVSAENELMKVTFTSKGGQVKKVELKKFRGLDSTNVKLAASAFDRIGYTINTGNNTTANTADLYFSSVDSANNADGSRSVWFTLHSADSTAGNSIIHRFTIRPNDYMLGFTAELTGADKLLTQGIMNLSWQYAAAQQESDLSFERQNTQVGYVKDGSFDYHTIGRRSDKDFTAPVSWIGVRQRFFFTILSAKNNFSSGRMEWTEPADSAKTIVQSTANMKLQVPAGATAAVPLSIYYGPSDYHILKKYDQKFEKLVNLGQGMYAFVRPLNKFVILPIFDFFRGMTANLGIAIALLTLFIRLVTSPLTYSSYLSGAKMKALRPELDELKKKFGDDQQGFAMEQMKLFREAGVNPLGGCIPALLQIPIFFALYSFFNSAIDLRGQSFWWADDLSQYDVIARLPFSIPMGFGDHISLFTLTAVITSFLISIYNMSMTPTQDNPALKYMPYIFPFILLFIFNRLPSALTWYYTVSNVMTLALQFVIQNYIINHDKIVAQLQANKKKPKVKSKWQERYDQMMESQKKLQDMKEKNNKK